MPLRLGDADDLASLPELDEAILLEELKIRYTDGRIYTYVGDILVALNPFKELPIYSAEVRERYVKSTLSQNPPHIFAVADVAFQLLQSTGRHQCCVISGESGAGKTESAKLLVSHLIWLSGGKTVLGQRILQVNPLLEAFGNSKTVINNNSSRFGKYLQLKFSGGRVCGAKINEYLLEKSRVVVQNEGEENFHVFYYMFAGLDAARKAKLQLDDSSSTYHYLCHGTSSSTHSPEEGVARFEEVCNAMDLVGFEPSVQTSIFMCLAAVLHLGNIELHEDTNEYSYVLEPRSGPVKVVADLLGVDIKHLIDSLTVNVSYAHGEVVRRHWNKVNAIAVRDAMAKALYDRLFRWIVSRINQLLAPTAAQKEEEREVGILDIFGFEKFTENSFEQLCINMANEQLQFFFVEHVFLLEMEEYRKEGVAGSSAIDCTVNKPLLELVFSKPVGLLAVLDEQCSFPRANDKSFVAKLNQVMKKKKPVHFVSSKDTASLAFTLVHYAGKVEYCSRGFLEKNRDIMPRSASALLQSSNNDLVNLLFNAAISKTGTLSVNRLTTLRLAKSFKKSKGRDSGRRGHSRRGAANAKTPTVGAQFKNSLQVLIEKLKGANPHFIRCIRPNPAKVPGYFHPETILTQLRYTGMLDTIRIRREGFPIRLSFREFLDLYGSIAGTNTLENNSRSCELVLQMAGCEWYRVGRTKVFLKQHHSDLLWQEMIRVNKAATILQKLSRGFVERVRFRGLLAVKRDQDSKLASLLSDISSRSEYTFNLQETLCGLDERNVQPSAPPLEFCFPPPPTSPPPPVAPSMSHLLVTPHMATPHLVFTPSSQTLPSVLPPPNFLAPPPEPYFANSDSEDENSAGTEITQPPPSPAGLEDFLIAPPPDTSYKSFGRQGTRKASERWFKETQVSLLQSPVSGRFPDWFHGIMSKHEAEEKLSDKPEGIFLVRVCSNRFGYAISVKRASGSCGHHMISQLEATGKFVVVGESKVHPSLAALLQFYAKKPAGGVGGDVLIMHCSSGLDGYTPRQSQDYATAAVNSPLNHLPRSMSVHVQRNAAAEGSHDNHHPQRWSCVPAAQYKKTKLSRTRSHEVGYGALKTYVTQKSPK